MIPQTTARLIHLVLRLGLGMLALLGAATLSACSDQPPPDPAVRKGAAVMRRELLYAHEDEWVRRLQEAEIDGTPGSELLVFYSRTADVLDLHSGTLEDQVYLKFRAGEYTAIADEDPEPFLLASSSSVYNQVGLMDSEGRRLWVYQGVRVYDMAVGDLDGDGELEFYVGTSDGLHCLDHNGQRIWEADSRSMIYHVTVVRPDWAEGPLALTLARGVLRFWDVDGNLIREIVPEVHPDHLETCIWPSANHLLTTTGGDIVVMDTELLSKVVDGRS